MVLNCFGVSLEISNAHKIEVLCGNSLQSDSSIELSARVQPFLIHHVASSSAIRAQILDLLLVVLMVLIQLCNLKTASSFKGLVIGPNKSS